MAQFKLLMEWLKDDPHSSCRCHESGSLNRISIQNLFFYISAGKTSVLIKENLVLKNMLKIWYQVRKIDEYANCFSLLSPLYDNPDFPYGLKVGLID